MKTLDIRGEKRSPLRRLRTAFLPPCLVLALLAPASCGNLLSDLTAEALMDGSEARPFRVHNGTQLREIGGDYLAGYEAWDLSDHYRIVEDMDISGFNPWPSIGDDTGGFTGSLDGGGHTIRTLNISGSADYQGLFGYIASSGEVGNLGLTNVGVSSTGEYVGGLAGYNAGFIRDCYVQGGSVDGGSRAGGLVGSNVGGSIVRCYSTAAVSGSSNVGGLVGASSGTVTDCYYDTDTTDQSDSYATGKTTSEMMQKATFSGWDFATVWGIDEGESYPYLLGENE